MDNVFAYDAIPLTARKVSLKLVHAQAGQAWIARRFMEEIGLPAAEIARHLRVTTSTVIRANERVNKPKEK